MVILRRAQEVQKNVSAGHYPVMIPILQDLKRTGAKNKEEKNKTIQKNLSAGHYPRNPARALRALGLLLADGTPTVGGGKTF